MFSFDLTNLLTIASNLFVGLVPIAGVIGGLALGIGLVRLVLREVRNLL